MLAAFMMSSILLNPQLLITSGILGPEAVAVRFLSCFLGGLGAGLCVRVFYKDKSYFNFSGFSESSGRDTDPNPVMRFLKNLGRNVRATAPWFLIGVLLSALFQRYVPAEAFAELFGSRRVSVFCWPLLSECLSTPAAEATVPLLQQWLASGMSMGSAADIYDHRSGDQDHQPGSAEDRAGGEKIRSLSGLCDPDLSGDRTCRGQNSIKRRKIQVQLSGPGIELGLLSQQYTYSRSRKGLLLVSKCGKCEKICPQHLPIRSLLEDVAAEFEKQKNHS